MGEIVQEFMVFGASKRGNWVSLSRLIYVTRPCLMRLMLLLLLELLLPSPLVLLLIMIMVLQLFIAATHTDATGWATWLAAAVDTRVIAGAMRYLVTRHTSHVTRLTFHHALCTSHVTSQSSQNTSSASFSLCFLSSTPIVSCFPSDDHHT